MVSLCEVCSVVLAVLAGHPGRPYTLEQAPIQAGHVEYVAKANTHQDPWTIHILVESVSLAGGNEFVGGDRVLGGDPAKAILQAGVEADHKAKQQSGGTITSILDIDPQLAAPRSSTEVKIGAIDLRHRFDGGGSELGRTRGQEDSENGESTDDQGKHKTNPAEIQSGGVEAVSNAGSVYSCPLRAEISGFPVGWGIAMGLILLGMWGLIIGGAKCDPVLSRLRGLSCTSTWLGGYSRRETIRRRWALCCLFGGVIHVIGIGLFVGMTILDMP